jgi:hypothetical protein
MKKKAPTPAAARARRPMTIPAAAPPVIPPEEEDAELCVGVGVTVSVWVKPIERIRSEVWVTTPEAPFVEAVDGEGVVVDERITVAAFPLSVPMPVNHTLTNPVPPPKSIYPLDTRDTSIVRVARTRNITVFGRNLSRGKWVAA